MACRQAAPTRRPSSRSDLPGNLGHLLRPETARVGKLLDREGAEGIHRPVALVAGAAGGVDQLRRTVELGEEPVDRRPPSHASASFTSAWGRIMRISEIEIMGRKRMKSRNRVAKSPIVPMKVAQSQRVG